MKSAVYKINIQRSRSMQPRKIYALLALIISRWRRIKSLWTRPFFFFLNDTAPTEIYTLSLHDALPISASTDNNTISRVLTEFLIAHRLTAESGDRKSTRLNSSHQIISYAVFCLKK